ncbi:MAG TPA: cytochrome c [Chloroflexota bacterium]|nr:cytochrome c [Chloroflexota bacterium]
MSTVVQPPKNGEIGAAGAADAAGALVPPLSPRSAHRRGLATLAIGVLAGLAVAGCTAAWPTRNELAAGSPASGLVSWINALPVESNRTIAPGERPALVLTSENRGKVLFGRYCDSCHYGGNENIGASLRAPQFKRSFATREKIAEFVRKGGFDMPAYSRTFLSDADLDAIAGYVLSLPEAGR